MLELIQRGIARYNLVNSLNVTSRTQAHIVLVYTFTQVAISILPVLVHQRGVLAWEVANYPSRSSHHLYASAL